MTIGRQTHVWITQAKLGDSLAVSKLLTAYHPILRARADSQMDAPLRARLEPEDVLQQVYLDVFRRIDRFDEQGPDSFVNWVLTILDHKLTDARRAIHRQMRDADREMRVSRSSSQSYSDLLDHLYADSVTASRLLRRDEALGALMACISQLSDPHRQVIQLRFLEGRPVSEVARRLRKTNAAVVALTRRALQALRGDMDGLGEFTRGA